ncbi:MAG: glutaredoxin [Promethearchaeia archaeon]|nr:MAG: glutaredoxin [Candidatus Lokiarchaeia archaeon]
MSSEIPFVEENGKVDHQDITVYALSTCGFCRRGLQFLRDRQVKFRYVYVDKIPYEVKNDLKVKLQEKFQRRVAFPFVVINDERALVGFVQREWEEIIKFNIKWEK